MMTRYGRSPWIDRFPKSRVPNYPRQRGPMTTDVVVIGGGLTGCAAAYAFAAAGVKVALLEADAIGRGATAAATGWMSDDPGVPFADLERALGLRAARQAFQSWRRASLDFGALLRRLGVRCDLAPTPTVSVAASQDQTTLLKRDLKARRDAGLEAPALNPGAIAAELGVAASFGIRHRDAATLDPYRACVGVARAAAARGAQIFERSPAVATTFTRKSAAVRTAGGSIATRAVIVATGVPTPLFKSLARHFWFRTAYFALTEPVPAKVRKTLGRRAAVIRDLADPPHTIRWIDDERLLVSGADADSPPSRHLDRLVVQRTGQLMYEASLMYPDISGLLPAYGWHAAYARTAEGLPYVGPHRNFPHHLFAFGDSSHSVTGAYLASRVLLRHYADELDAADAVFAFRR